MEYLTSMLEEIAKYAKKETDNRVSREGISLDEIGKPQLSLKKHPDSSGRFSTSNFLEKEIKTCIDKVLLNQGYDFKKRDGRIHYYEGNGRTLRAKIDKNTFSYMIQINF